MEKVLGAGDPKVMKFRKQQQKKRELRKHKIAVAKAKKQGIKPPQKPDFQIEGDSEISAKEKMNPDEQRPPQKKQEAEKVRPEKKEKVRPEKREKNLGKEGPQKEESRDAAPEPKAASWSP